MEMEMAVAMEAEMEIAMAMEMGMGMGMVINDGSGNHGSTWVTNFLSVCSTRMRSSWISFFCFAPIEYILGHTQQ